MEDEFRRWATVGSGLAELVLNRAEQLVKELVREGEIQREAAAGVVRDILERTKDDREEVARALRAEIQRQTAQLGVASAREVERLREEIDRLTERMARLEARSGVPSATENGGATRKGTARKTTQKKGTDRQAGGKKGTSTKSRRDGGTATKASRKKSSPRQKNAARAATGRKPGSGRTKAS